MNRERECATMQLSDRKKLVLKAVVEDYIETAEPVSSKTLVARLDLGVSSATIRNEMSELVELGLLEQPHTSAGRIPTPQGYRIYVNELMGRGNVPTDEAQVIEAKFREKPDLFESVVQDASRLTSQITALPSYAQMTVPGKVTASRFELVHIDDHNFIIVVLLSNKSVQNRLVTLPTATNSQQLIKLAALFNASFTGKPEHDMTAELIAATERAAGDQTGLTAVIAGFTMEILMKTKVQQTVVSGTSNLLGHPEFQDMEKARRILGYLSNEQELQRLPTPDSDSVKIMIGPENVAEALRDSSVVVAKYDAGDNMQGLIGVIGPTRMDYAKVAARLSYIAGGLAKALAMGIPIGPGDFTQGDTES
ncbi:MAG: heat-inducible transcriptional repressor HrcA [Oscillospiraceae bacterium]|nr:heat-inducible transcriptional repressor HrcA [Oscillospiraceae bacterium]